MTHAHDLALLSAYLDGELGVDAAQALEARLRQEPALEANLARLRRTREAVRETASREAPPLAWTLKAMALVQPRPAQRPGWLLAGLVAGLGSRRADVVGHSLQGVLRARGRRKVRLAR